MTKKTFAKWDLMPEHKSMAPFDARISDAWAAGARWVLERIQADRADPSTVSGEVEAIVDQARKRQKQRPRRKFVD